MCFPRRGATGFELLMMVLLADQTSAFVPHVLQRPNCYVNTDQINTNKTNKDMLLYSTRVRDNVQSSTMNGESLDDAGPSGGGGGGLLNIGAGLKSQLASAFTALDERDQYDAVLTGLCAKILDDPDRTSYEDSNKAQVALQDPIRLLEEMNLRKVAASGRSLMALVDATVLAQDAKTMSQVLSLAKRNGGISQFGNQQANIIPLPPMGTSKVTCPDGSKKTRSERLAALPDVPTDDRATEISSALTVASIMGFCGTVNILGIDEISVYTGSLFALMATIGIVDNFYDVFKFGANTFGKDKMPSLPEKLPLSLGTGKLTGTVMKGFNRLLQVDTERECQCEAAAFFAAYALGVPCFAFRPNALEAAILVAESTRDENSTLDTLLTNNGILKMLIWLMAPVAMESMKHPQLISSDPREAEGLLKRLESSEIIDKDELWWLQDEPYERLDLLKWAYTEADLLIRANQECVEEIARRLAGGAATVGDCVAVVEDW